MIALITGKVGGGKTLSAVGEMLSHNARGGTVATNVKFKWDKYCALAARRHSVALQQSQYVWLDLNENPNWHELVPWGDAHGGFPVYCYLDEIHLWFNARDWSETQKKHKALLDFISHCRKCGIELRFICQSANRLEKQFRDQCEFEFYNRHLRDVWIPVFSWIMGRFPFDRFLRVTRDLNGEGPSKVSEWKIVRPDKELFECYDSFEFLTASMQAMEQARERVKRKKLARAGFWAGGWQVWSKRLAVVVGLVLGWYTLRKWG